MHLFVTGHLLAHELVIEDVYLSDYRDNTLPFSAGIIKPLPVALLQKIANPCY